MMNSTLLSLFVLMLSMSTAAAQYLSIQDIGVMILPNNSERDATKVCSTDGTASNPVSESKRIQNELNQAAKRAINSYAERMRLLAADDAAAAAAADDDENSRQLATLAAGHDDIDEHRELAYCWWCYWYPPGSCWPSCPFYCCNCCRRRELGEEDIMVQGTTAVLQQSIRGAQRILQITPSAPTILENGFWSHASIGHRKAKKMCDDLRVAVMTELMGKIQSLELSSNCNALWKKELQVGCLYFDPAYY